MVIKRFARFVVLHSKHDSGLQTAKHLKRNENLQLYCDFYEKFDNIRVTRYLFAIFMNFKNLVVIQMVYLNNLAAKKVVSSEISS